MEPAPDISGSTAVTFGMDYPQTLVKTVLKDANGNVLDEREEVYDGDIDTVVQQYVTEETRKGAIVE